MAEGVKISPTNASYSNTTNLSEGYKEYAYAVSDNDVDVTFAFSEGAWIRKIEVTREETVTWNYNTINVTLDKSRPNKGYITFNPFVGTLAAETDITDIPGITITIPQEMYVHYVPSNGTMYNGYALYGAPGQSIQFTPSVNGFLSFKGNIYSATTGDIIIGSSWCHNDLTEHNVPLRAGQTYTMTAGGDRGYDIASIGFRPAFLNSTSGTDQTNTAFLAGIGTPAKNGFPKLIDPAVTTQQDGVKFAGDKTKVHLYKNNDVELLDAGTGILIRGTVLDKYGNDGLVAYYYLDSNVLKMNPEYEDQAYITGFSNPNGYAFSNSKQNDEYGPMSVVDNPPSSITVQKDGEAPCTVTPVFSEFRWVMYIPISPLKSGSTYRITIPEGYVKDNKGALNPEIVHTFSVKNASELEVKMIYPSGLATVGTTIILDTYVNGSTSGLSLDDSKKVTGILSTDGEDDMVIHAGFSTNQLVFKPESTLKPNKTYTLTINYNADDNVITSKELNSTIYHVTHTKVFTFKTGSASGTAPHVTETTPSPNVELSASTHYDGGTISFTFDKSVEIEPYSTVNATPVNGSEATASGKTEAPGTTPKNPLIISDDKKTVSFHYSTDGLKYDLYYEVVIPANTVVSDGGTPNGDPIILRFKMGKKQSSLVGTKVFEGYGDGPIYHPYTWNFTNIGTNESTTLIDLASETTGDKYITSRWQKNVNSNSYGNYVADQENKDPKFPQGDVLSYEKNSQNMEIKEASGLRWSLTKRFGSGKNRVQIPVSKDSENAPERGTGLHITGNTHYLTIPDVPANAKLYIKANKSDMFNINSPNATFVQGAANGDETFTKGAKTSSSMVYIINCTGGDVSFCLDDVYFEMIAVATEEKTITDVLYATNARSYPVDYSLDEAFLGTGVTAYKITGVSGNSVVTSPVTRVPATTNTNQYNGVMLHGNAGSWPLFTLDVNSTTETFTDNKLIGVVSGSTTGALDQKTGNNYNYLLATGGYSVKYEDGAETGSVNDDIVNQLGFYLVLKNGTKLSDGSTYSAEEPNDNTAYLQLPEKYVVHNQIGSSSARQFFYIDFDDHATHVNAVRSNSSIKTSNDAYYSPQGVRVLKPTKGLYIHNGKKIIVK